MLVSSHSHLFIEVSYTQPLLWQMGSYERVGLLCVENFKKIDSQQLTF